MPVWTIVKTVAPWCCGRPVTLLPSAEGNSVSGRPQHRAAIVLTISKQASNNCFITQSSIHHSDILFQLESATAILWTLFCDLNHSDGVVYIAARAYTRFPASIALRIKMINTGKPTQTRPIVKNIGPCYSTLRLKLVFNSSHSHAEINLR